MLGSRWRAVACACGLAGFAAIAQSMPEQTGKPPQNPPAAAKPSDYSKEPAVIEQQTAKFLLEPDGTSTVDMSTRVRVQSPAGVKQFGLLRFPYASATSNLEIVFVRVTKPDGKLVATPMEGVLDMPSEITRLAPFYSDLKEKQVAVKGLEVGDVLEFASRTKVTSPLDPRQYWFSYEFTRNVIVLEEVVQFRAPRDRYVNVRSAQIQPVISEDGGFRVYTWKTASLEVKGEEKAANAAVPKLQDPPDIQVSTFRSWEEVGEWFRGLMAARAAPDNEIRAKTEELTRGLATDEQKIRVIYDYVSSKYRYISVSLGIGRYQPHTAAEVLSNGYGDCKDKHTLLASLLTAAGVKVNTALVNTALKIEPEIPSPSQFDHVVSAAGDGQTLEWMDATLEVAPLGYLIPTVRGQQALLIPASGPARLVRTPEQLPFVSAMDFQMDGNLDDKGTFTGKAQMTARGDLEVILRAAFRQVGQARWKELMQGISANMSFGGTVTDVTADPPEDTSTAFHIRYQYERKDFGDWPNRRIIAALPPIFLPEAPDDTEKSPNPVDLEGPIEYTLRSDIKLPSGSAPQVPFPRSNNQPFAEYHSKASFANGTLHIERELYEKTQQVPQSQLENYRKFRAELLDEWATFIPLNRSGFTVAAGNSQDSEANEAYSKGLMAALNNSAEEAIRQYRVAVQKDPKFALAWIELGVTHYSLGVLTDAAKEISNGISLDPAQAERGKTIARQMMRSGRYPEALEIWRAVAKADPDDIEAVRATGIILVQLKRYDEAVPVLRAAAEASPADFRLELQLADALFPAGKKEQGLEALRKAIELDQHPGTLNEAAYLLAEDNSHLTEAEAYAVRAIAETENATRSIALDQLSREQLAAVNMLSYYWDTLGWIYFRMGQLESARSYLTAAWNLGQLGVIGDHLGQLLEKQGLKDKAAEVYTQAIEAKGAPPETRERLNRLRGTRVLPQELFWRAGEQLSHMRSVKLPVLSHESVSAEFYVLLERGKGATAARYIQGSESLRGATKALMEASYDVVIPESSRAKIVRRGVLTCQHEPAGCMFVMLPPGDALAEPPPLESQKVPN